MHRKSHQGLLLGGLLAFVPASVPQDAPRGRLAPRALTPLLAETKTHFWHLVLQDAGQHLVRTDRASGEMQEVLSTGTVEIPSVRVKFTTSRLMGVLLHDDRLHVLEWSVTAYDRPVDGLVDCDPGEAWLKEHGRRSLRVIDAADLGGPLRVVAGAVHVFGRPRT